MGAGPDQNEFVYLVQQQPVRLDMKISYTPPLTRQHVIAKSLGKRLVRQQQFNDALQLVEILGPTVESFDISFELSGPAN